MPGSCITTFAELSRGNIFFSPLWLICLEGLIKLSKKNPLTENRQKLMKKAITNLYYFGGKKAFMVLV